MAAGRKPLIRVGVGGWVFPPWRNNFYPKGLKQADELAYASRHLTSIEINGSFYRMPTRASFAHWYDETPEDFVFALKGSRFITNRRVLAEAGPAIERFFGSGVIELKEKLGPVNWQFMPTKRYDATDFSAFLDLLPREVGGQEIRHAVELRHDSFAVPEVINLLRDKGIAVVQTDKPGVPHIHDITAPFVYARLQAARETVETGYTPSDLAMWAERARSWAEGALPAGLPTIASPAKKAQSRDVFVYMINGFKPKAPAAAMALLDKI